jgi:hypothetical protein
MSSFQRSLSAIAVLALAGVVFMSWRQVQQVAALRRDVHGLEERGLLTGAGNGAESPSRRPSDDRALAQVLLDIQRQLSALKERADRQDASKPAGSKPAVVAQPPSKEQQEAVVVADALVSGAITRQRWTLDDHEKLRSQLSRLSDEDYDAIIHKLGDALVKGTVKKDYAGPM